MFREAGTQVSPVTMSCPSWRKVIPLPCSPLGIKDSLKEDVGLFAFCFWLFNVEGFGRENKWLKGELLKENC
jgi:hypothetical protein